MLEHKADAVISHANPVVFACGFEAFEIGNLLEGLRRFDLFDHSLNSAQQRHIRDLGQIGVKRFADDGSDVAWLQDQKDRSARLLDRKPQAQA